VGFSNEADHPARHQHPSLPFASLCDKAQECIDPPSTSIIKLLLDSSQSSISKRFVHSALLFRVSARLFAVRWELGAKSVNQTTLCSELSALVISGFVSNRLT